ncbi:MAG: Hsp20/alpha crystallin family protein [Kiritimatiellales bacterium]|nr:Hsp20/alpha crystallin family protein [Kiritimatiellales bacterium]
MTPSPFHGIFSAFGQDQNEPSVAGQEPAFNFSEAEEKTPPPVVEQKPTLQKGQIAVDIYEQDGYYVVRAPIAGVKLSDLDIEVDEKILTISGARSLDDTIPDNQYYLQECFWGQFSRSITLPCTIDPKKVKATFSKDSILKILIPKEERVKIVRVHEG